MKDLSRPLEIGLIAVIVLLAFFLRAAWHESSPGGWRDDELSNALVVSGHVLDGEVQIYYDDASGHEGLYHWMQAATMALFGPGVWGVRGVSILLGTASVLLTYLLARQMYDPRVALLAAFLLAVSFWGLMYSRSGQRHVFVTTTTLLGFWALWSALPGADEEPNQPRWSMYALAGAATGIGFYSYFASRGVPLIMIAWLIAMAVLNRAYAGRVWRGILAATTVAVLLAIPLVVVLQQQPEAEARIEELALPIYDAQNGDFSTLGQYTLTTLSMFTHDGDDESLYNIPHRPAFGLLGGLLFWAGVIFSLWWAFGPRRDPASAFLLLWLGAGLAPGMLSVPAASLGHTILAQSPTMILVALAVVNASDALNERLPNIDRRILLISGVLLVGGWEAARGLRDYYVNWPQDDFMRVLHHSDVVSAARAAEAGELTSGRLAVAGYLTEPWDGQAVDVTLGDDTISPLRWNPQYARLYPAEGGFALVPAYLSDSWGTADLIPLIDSPYLYGMPAPPELPGESLEDFTNGLDLMAVSDLTIREDGNASLTTTWRAKRPLDLPPYILFSKPPAPGENADPRLAIFVHVMDADGQWAAGADGLWVDPYTLRTGDVFIQWHTLDVSGLPPGRYSIRAGLYDPVSGMRILTEEGADHTVMLDEWAR